MATQDDIMALAHEEGKCVHSPEVAAASARSISSPSCVAADRTIACDTPGMRSTIARCESKNGAMAMHGQ